MQINLLGIILVNTNMNATARCNDQIADLSQRLKVLSVESRLRMLLLLRQRNLCVGALACRLGLTQGAVSQHLKILRDAGLVTAERDGYYVHHRVGEQALAQLRRELDGMLERLETGRTSEDVADGTTSVQCKKKKEEACARRKRRASAERDVA